MFNFVKFVMQITLQILNIPTEIYMPNYNPNTNKFSYFLECCLLFICIVFSFLIIMSWVIVYKFPQIPQFIGSIIIDEGCPIIITLLVCYIFPCYMMFVMYLNLCTITGIIFIYGVVVVPFIMLEFRVNRNPSKYFACPELRSPPLLWNAWRTVQIFQSKINDLLGVVIIPTQFLLGKLVVLIVFLIMKHGKELSTSKRVMWIAWAALAGLFWSLVLLMGGYIHLYGRKILDSWKYHKWVGLTNLEKKQMKKFRKSCCPLSISYGKAYIIKRLTVLKFIRGIIAAIFRMLLTIGLEF